MGNPLGLVKYWSRQAGIGGGLMQVASLSAVVAASHLVVRCLGCVVGGLYQGR